MAAVDVFNLIWCVSYYVTRSTCFVVCIRVYAVQRLCCVLCSLPICRCLSPLFHRSHDCFSMMRWDGLCTTSQLRHPSLGRFRTAPSNTNLSVSICITAAVQQYTCTPSAGYLVYHIHSTTNTCETSSLVYRCCRCSLMLLCCTAVDIIYAPAII